VNKAINCSRNLYCYLHVSYGSSDKLLTQLLLLSSC
jgi:hypothetical protein